LFFFKLIGSDSASVTAFAEKLSKFFENVIKYTQKLNIFDSFYIYFSFQINTDNRRIDKRSKFEHKIRGRLFKSYESLIKSEGFIQKTIQREFCFKIDLVHQGKQSKTGLQKSTFKLNTDMYEMRSFIN